MSYVTAKRPLSDFQIATLQALGEYRFLIVPQITRIIGTSSSYFSSKVVPGLDTTRTPLIGRIRYKVSRALGKRHDLFFLTRHGAFALSEIFGRPADSFRTAEPRHAIERDFPHRVAYIDIGIRFREWITAQEGADVLRFFDYFDRVPLDMRPGAKRQGFLAKTRTQIHADRYIEPDGVAIFTLGNRRRVCAIEMHMDRPPGEIVAQLDGHMDALQSGTLSGLYDCAESNLVLSVYKNPETLGKVTARLHEIPSASAFLPAFHFATLQDVRTDFSTAWVTAEGEPSSFFR
jgi:hypothetical protein